MKDWRMDRSPQLARFLHCDAGDVTTYCSACAGWSREHILQVNPTKTNRSWQTSTKCIYPFRASIGIYVVIPDCNLKRRKRSNFKKSDWRERPPKERETGSNILLLEGHSWTWVERDTGEVTENDRWSDSFDSYIYPFETSIWFIMSNEMTFFIEAKERKCHHLLNTIRRINWRETTNLSFSFSVCRRNIVVLEREREREREKRETGSNIRERNRNELTRFIHFRRVGKTKKSFCLSAWIMEKRMHVSTSATPIVCFAFILTSGNTDLSKRKRTDDVTNWIMHGMEWHGHKASCVRKIQDWDYRFY